MKVYGIDQSLRGFAHMVLEDGKSVFTERVDTSAITGFDRIKTISGRVTEMIATHAPDVVVMEDYAYSAQTNTITQLAELGGVVKWRIYEAGYKTGRDAILRREKVFFTQGQGAMKKFCLASGAIKKDSRYLLEVFERLQKSFKDDDQADAYMHAWMASIVVGVIRGDVRLSDLTSYQQEALIERASKTRKGLTITKALKLPDAEKQKLVKELEVRS